MNPVLGITAGASNDSKKGAIFTSPTSSFLNLGMMRFGPATVYLHHTPTISLSSVDCRLPRLGVDSKGDALLFKEIVEPQFDDVLGGPLLW